VEFSPNNKIVKLCIQAMALEEKGKPEEAGNLFLEGWNEATNDFEHFLTAFYISRHQQNVSEKLKWLMTTLEFALRINDHQVQSAFSPLYKSIAKCYEDLNDPNNAKKYNELANQIAQQPTDKGPFYHGTKANLKVGDLLTPGFNSNYKSDLLMNHIYFTALMNGAGLAAALA